MINTIEDYLSQLKKNLAGCDPAMIQDALSDAEEYLRSELEYAQKNSPETNSDQLLPDIVEKYGSPPEIADSYKDIEDIESRLPPTVIRHPRIQRNNGLSRFLNILSDPKAWSGLLYGILSMLTGIFYFSWAVTGISLSLGLMILIIGLPVTAAFLLSVKGISFVEGRFIEALLGIRMPRKPQSKKTHLNLWDHLKSLFTDDRIWLTLVYMVLMLPLGVIYFTVYITLLAISISLIASPFLGYYLNVPIIQTIDASYVVPLYLSPLTILLSLIIFLLTLHLAKILGRWHGVMAKSMLVRQ